MSGRYDWDAIRHAYESGSDVHTLVSLHGLRPDTLRRKARDQGWQRRPTDTSPTTTPTATTTAGILTTATVTAPTATASAPTASVPTVSTVTTEKVTAGQGPTATAGISTGQTATATTQTATATAPTVSTVTTEKVTAGQGPTATAGISTTQTATATAPTVSTVTTEKATAGQGPTATPGIPAETMRTRAVTREDILRRHKDEWTRHAELVDAALDDSDIELAKLAKVLAETMRIRQDGERRAWGINDKTDTDLSGPMTISWRSLA